MADPKIHLIVLSSEDLLYDRGEVYLLASFGGVAPNSGDCPLDPRGANPLREVRQV